MKQYSTAYIFGFAAAICVVFSVFVAGSVVLLKDRQEANKILDRQKKVLGVAELMRAGEAIEADEVARRFEASIVARVVDTTTGAYVDGVDAASFDQGKAAKDPASSREAPPNGAKVLRVPNHGLVFEVVEGGEVNKIILPIEGKGLWSTMYGFIALEADTKTVSGITFYAHGETPGLGGEIENPAWTALWRGRKAFDDKWEPVIDVIKGLAGPAAEDPHHIDGLSGATITSRGVGYTVRFWLGPDAFGPYLTKFRDGQGRKG